MTMTIQYTDKRGVEWEYFEKFDELLTEYMPDQGQGESKASQAATAVNKLIYKWYNDGDVFKNTENLDGWVNNLSDYANWLSKYIDGAEEILSRVWDVKNGFEYEELLRDLANEILTKENLEELDKEVRIGDIYDCSGSYFYGQVKENNE